MTTVDPLVQSLLNEIADTERALREAPELIFEVVKTLNAWPNKKVTRMLRLTATGVANVRPGSYIPTPTSTLVTASTPSSTLTTPTPAPNQTPTTKPTPMPLAATTIVVAPGSPSTKNDASSFYEYERIIRVTVLELNQLQLEYKGAKHPYIYKSPIALQIVQAIQHRIKLVTTVKKKRQVLGLARSMALGQSSSSLSSSSDNSINISVGANNGSAVIEASRTTSWRMSRSPTETPLPDTSSSSAPPSITSTTPTSPRAMATTTNTQQQQQQQQQQQPPQLRERAGTERTMRSRKLEHLLGDTEQQRIETTVNTILMDGVRYEEARLVRQFIDGFSSIEKNPITAALAVRNLLDHIKQRLTIATSSYKDQIYDKLAVTGEVKALVEAHISTCIERIVLTPLYDRIMRPMNKVCCKTDTAIERKLDQLRALSQSQIGVPNKFISKSNWQFAIVEIDELSSALLPSQKLQCILDCVQTIIDSAQREFGGSGLGGSTVTLPADDLLPIFIYVVTHSSLGGLESQSQFIWNLADPDDLTGERGYYLTMFSSVIEFIKDFDPTAAVHSNRATRTRLASTTAGPAKFE